MLSSRAKKCSITTLARGNVPDVERHRHQKYLPSIDEGHLLQPHAGLGFQQGSLCTSTFSSLRDHRKRAHLTTD